MNLGFGKKNDLIETPDDLYEYLDNIYEFDFDPCPINPDFNGLSIGWGNSNYVNPPYSEIPKWISKAIQELHKGKLSVFLIPVRTNTKYFFDLILPNASEIRFIKERIKFKRYQSSLPIALYLIIFDPNKKKQILIKNSLQEYTTFDVLLKK